MKLKLIAVSLLASLAWPLQAALVDQHFTLLTDDGASSPFVGRAPGPDLLWGTADDVEQAGRNGAGHASIGTLAGDAIAFSFGGTIASVFDDVAGSFEFSSYDTVGSLYCDVCVPPIVGAEVQASLSTGPGALNAGAFSSPFEFSSSVDLINDAGDVFRNTSNGLVLPRGLAAADVTSDAGLITHLETLVASLPADWALLAVSFDDIEIIAGPNIGLTGSQSQAFFLTAVPLPPALALAVGPLVLMLRRRQVNPARSTR